MIGLPGAIVLYYTVSNLIAITQQHYVLKDDAEDMIEIADKAYDKKNKKPSAKMRAKDAKEANIIRIKAKDNSFKSSKSAKKRKEKL